ncbi:MAG TPA: hypothetical protein VF421_10760 [Niabella sp.]
MKRAFVTDRIVRLAKQMKAKVILEPDYGFVGHITFRNNKKTLFRDTSFNINPLGSVQIAKDKGYSAFFLKKFGYKVPDAVAIFSKKINANVKRKKNAEDGFLFAKSIGFPVIIKPNDKSKGEGVTKVYNKSEYAAICRKLLKTNNVVLIQEFCNGNDYRIVVLDGEIISAYQRLPLTVIGNGKSTILQLLMSLQKKFKKDGRDTVIDINDPRINLTLKRHKLTFNTILAKDKAVSLLPNANLSSGGTAVDVTDKMHPTFRKLAINVTKDMCLRLCGVDILTDDIAKPIDKYKIIEINAAPGLDNYSSIGKKQDKIVDGLYKKILLALEKL